MTTDDRPVHRDPAYEDRDPQLPYADQEPARAGWDLAFGCKLSFGPVENGGPLRVNLLLQFFQVLGTTDLLSFKQSHAAAGERIFSFYIFAMFFQHNGAIAVG